MENFTDYRPRVVVIEASKLLHPEELVYPTEDGGASAGILVQLGKEKGYELVCHTGSNCIFVLNEDFPKFKIEDNSLSKLYIYTQSTAVLRLVEKGVYTEEQGEYWIEYMSAMGQVIQHSDGFTPTKIF